MLKPKSFCLFLTPDIRPAFPTVASLGHCPVTNELKAEISGTELVILTEKIKK